MVVPVRRSCAPVCQGDRRDDIADGIDAGYIRAVVLVHENHAPIGFYPDLFKAYSFRVRGHASGGEHDIASDGPGAAVGSVFDPD